MSEESREPRKSQLHEESGLDLSTGKYFDIEPFTEEEDAWFDSEAERERRISLLSPESQRRIRGPILPPTSEGEAVTPKDKSEPVD